MDFSCPLLPGGCAVPGPRSACQRPGQRAQQAVLLSQRAGALPRADSAASLLFKLEKAKLALAQLHYGGTRTEAGAAGRCGTLRAAHVADKPSDKPGSAGLTLPQRGQQRTPIRPAARCKASSSTRSRCPTEVLLPQSGISTLPAKKIA